VTTRRAFVACAVVLAVVGLLLAGCGGNSGPAPGTGTSLADKMYKAASPVAGETVFTNNVDDPTPFLMDRFMSAQDNNADMKYEYSDTKSGGVQDSLTLTFNDKSALTVKMVPVGGDQGLKVDSVEVTRP
jgi:hypothetical protein